MMTILHDALQSISEDRIRNHIRALEGVRHPRTAPAALEQAANYIYDELAFLKYEMTEHRFTSGGEEFRNIDAEL